MKAAPFLREGKNHPEYSFTVLHTGQHSDYLMSKIFFEEMQMPNPDFYLGAQDGLPAERLRKMVQEIKIALKQKTYSGVVVFGDVDSTLAGALAACGDVPIFHIEAGLRSQNWAMPEERNRVLIDQLSDMLFTTEPSANENLKKEGFPDTKVRYVGNLMIENLERFSRSIKIAKQKKYVVVTLHRAENVNNPQILEDILIFLVEISKKEKLVIPLHPTTKKKIEAYGLSRYLKDIVTVPPLGYLSFIKLVANSKGIITDSGGIQEETTHLGVSCVTIRDTTERPITVELGSNKLIPVQNLSVSEVIKHLNRKNFKKGHIPLWDSGVSKRIFENLNDFYNNPRA